MLSYKETTRLEEANCEGVLAAQCGAGMRHRPGEETRLRRRSGLRTSVYRRAVREPSKVNATQPR